jgi:hypothetical protein
MSDELIVAPAIVDPNGHADWEAPETPLAKTERNKTECNTTEQHCVNPLLHSTVAQQILKDTSPTTFDDFITKLSGDIPIQYMPLQQNVLFLGHLCACGLYNEAEAFITTIENKSELLNSRNDLLYEGTVLNMALYWNSGDLGYKFFTMLTSYGAMIMPDGYNLLPHEQTGTIWSSMMDNYYIGNRDPSEFTTLYTQIYLALE